jgi:hypothetical protein
MPTARASAASSICSKIDGSDATHQKRSAAQAEFQGRKQFLFEKKNQKTFANCVQDGEPDGAVSC